MGFLHQIAQPAAAACAKDQAAPAANDLAPALSLDVPVLEGADDLAMFSSKPKRQRLTAPDGSPRSTEAHFGGPDRTIQDDVDEMSALDAAQMFLDDVKARRQRSAAKPASTGSARAMKDGPLWGSRRFRRSQVGRSDPHSDRAASKGAAAIDLDARVLQDDSPFLDKAQSQMEVGAGAASRAIAATARAAAAIALASKQFTQSKSAQMGSDEPQLVSEQDDQDLQEASQKAAARADARGLKKRRWTRLGFADQVLSELDSDIDIVGSASMAAAKGRPRGHRPFDRSPAGFAANRGTLQEKAAAIDLTIDLAEADFADELEEMDQAGQAPATAAAAPIMHAEMQKLLDEKMRLMTEIQVCQLDLSITPLSVLSFVLSMLPSSFLNLFGCPPPPPPPRGRLVPSS